MGEGAAGEVLVVSRDAAEYVQILEGKGIAARATTSAAEAAARRGDAPVVLGDPGLLVEILPALDGVRWVQSTWAGVRPLREVAAAGVTVTGVKDVFGPQMAEYVLGYLLAHELGVLKRHAWQGEGRWVAAPTGRLAGKTLGVLGTGSIGRVVASRAAGLGMRVLGCSRGGASVEPFEKTWPVSELQDFLAQCDHVAAVLPETPQTIGLLNAGALAAMRKGAVLVNAGRGSLVNEAALLDALASGHLGGAVLDVFNTEPLPQGHPFWNAPGLLVTAHVAAWSQPADIVGVFLDNLARFRAGEPLKYVFDAHRGY